MRKKPFRRECVWFRLVKTKTENNTPINITRACPSTWHGTMTQVWVCVERSHLPYPTVDAMTWDQLLLIEYTTSTFSWTTINRLLLLLKVQWTWQTLLKSNTSNVNVLGPILVAVHQPVAVFTPLKSDDFDPWTVLLWNNFSWLSGWIYACNCILMIPSDCWCLW